MSFFLNKKILVSVLFPALLFLIFLISFHPVLNSDDDFYFLYKLGGGYGDNPTLLLHYNYALNPFLTWPISVLFEINPYFNWYTLSLLLIHFISCCFLIYVSGSLMNRLYSAIFFLLFFVVIEARLLMSFHYSNAALIAGIGGFAGLFYYYSVTGTARPSKRILLFSCLLIIVSALLRFHIAAFYGLLSTITFLFFLKPKNLVLYFKIIVVTGAVIVAFLGMQRVYYQVKIPNWQAEERYRQSFYKIINRSIIVRDNHDTVTNLKSGFIRAGFLYDTSFTGINDLKFLLKNSAGIKIEGTKRAGLYWLYIENRANLLFLAGSLLLLYSFQRVKFSRAIGLLLVTLGLLGCLFLFYKITATMLLGVVALLMISIFFSLADLQFKRSLIGLISFFVIVLSCIWLFRLARRTDNQNKQAIENTRCILQEIGRIKNNLVVSTDNRLPIKKYAIWDSPASFPTPNLIYKEHALNFEAKKTLARYSVKDLLGELPYRNDIFLTGRSLEIIEGYYAHIRKVNVKIDTLGGSGCLPLYRLSLK